MFFILLFIKIKHILYIYIYIYIKTIITLKWTRKELWSNSYSIFNQGTRLRGFISVQKNYKQVILLYIKFK